MLIWCSVKKFILINFEYLFEHVYISVEIITSFQDSLMCRKFRETDFFQSLLISHFEVFTVTFNQINSSLLSEKINTDPKLSNGSVHMQ